MNCSFSLLQSEEFRESEFDVPFPVPLFCHGPSKQVGFFCFRDVAS